MSKHGKGSPQKNMPVWDVLSGFSAAVGQMTNVPALLIPYLGNRELIDKIGDRARFFRLSAILENDVRRMTQQYRDIRSLHDGRRGGTTNEREWMQAIDISEKYRGWAQDFDDVVIPTFSDMLAMILEVEPSARDITVPSAVAVTEQFPN